ncbi:hypothetical protein, membrane [gut metagenome]|uniref:DUF4956 domain-containing protein n=1 Tax=gut metagenome TaxID=749906 RepID=J9H6Q4_9ZZZZ
MTEFISDYLSYHLCLTINLIDLLLSFSLNFIVVWIVVHFFYYPKGRRRDYYFTFLLLSVSIFMLIHLLLCDSGDMGIGAALGLFAIFGIIRYRTESVPIREMTYLFFLVALSVLNAKTSHSVLLDRFVINLLFILVVGLSERWLSINREACKLVKYDNINLILPEREAELKADLEKRLGVKVLRVEVGAVDFLKDMAMLRVYYIEVSSSVNSVNSLFKIPNDHAL